MQRKTLKLWLYNIALTAMVALLLWTDLPWQHAWPPLMTVLAFTLIQLAVWHYGFPVPSMGLNSMERVPQVAALCLFPLPVAICINALPGLIWPFINHRYRQGSWSYGAIRAVHNAAMLLIISWLGGTAFRMLGGSLPLSQLRWSEVDALFALALTMQVANSVMILAFFAIDGRDVKRLATWDYLWADLLFVPLGILSALIYANTDSITMSMYVLLVLLLVVTFHELNDSRNKIALRLDALDAASSARRGVAGSMRIEELAERLYAEMASMFQFHVAFVAVYEAESKELDVVIETVRGVRRPRCRKPADQGLAGYVMQTGKPVLIDAWANAPAELRERAILAPDEDPGSVLMVPMRVGERIIGLLSVQHARSHYYSDADKNTLLAIANDIAPVLADARTFQELDDYRLRLEDKVDERTRDLHRAAEEREKLLSELQAQSELLARQSREDALTGLANRRRFDERLVDEIERARRYQHPLSFALLDIDHFKRINDSAGHAGGDAVLVRFAETLKQTLRASDFVARIGGEEFAVLFPETAGDLALAKVESLRRAIEACDLSAIRAGMTVTTSAGVAAWFPGESSDSLLRRADVALYRAKSEGRNRIVMAEPWAGGR